MFKRKPEGILSISSMYTKGNALLLGCTSDVVGANNKAREIRQ